MSCADPFTGRMDILSRGQIHDRVRSPARRPAHLLDLGIDAREHGRVADVRVHLHEEPGADDHRLRLGVVDVRGDDRAAARNFAAHQFRLDLFALRNEGHFLRDQAQARIVHLRNVARTIRGGRLGQTFFNPSISNSHGSP